MTEEEEKRMREGVCGWKVVSGERKKGTCVMF